MTMPVAVFALLLVSGVSSYRMYERLATKGAPAIANGNVLQRTSAQHLGHAVADTALAFMLGTEQYSALFGDRLLSPPVPHALGPEGLEALLWSEEFSTALVQEIQEGPLLENVMTSDLLTQALRGKGVLVGVNIPGIKSDAVKKAEILGFSGERVGPNTPQPVLQPGAATAQVDALMKLIDVPSFLALARPILKKFMQQSPVLRRACTPVVLARVMKGMNMHMKIMMPLKDLTITSEMQDIVLTSTNEPRSCLAGVTFEFLNPLVDAEGEMALKIGMATTFARELGVQGFRYMLQQLQEPMGIFLRESGVLLEVMTASVLQRLLGATEMKFGILGGLGMVAPKTNSAKVKCVCDGTCPAHSRGTLDNPSSSVNKASTAVGKLEAPAGHQYGYRCPVSGRVDTSGRLFSLPCCASTSQSACVAGLGEVLTYDDLKTVCQKLGDGWHAGQRCMPLDPVLHAECTRTEKGMTCQPGRLSEDRAGLSESLLSLEGGSYLTPRIQSAFETGGLAATYALRLLSGKRGDLTYTVLTQQLLGRRGFQQLLNSEPMRAALTDELRYGPLLGRVLTASKLTELMGRGKKAPSKAGMKMNVKLPAIKVAEVEIVQFIGDEPNAVALPSISTKPATTNGTSLREKAGQAMAALVHADGLISPDVNCLLSPDDLRCSFVIPLVSFLRGSGVLLDVMHSNGGAVLRSVLEGRRLQMVGPGGLHINNKIEAVGENELEVCPRTVPGDCSCGKNASGPFLPERDCVCKVADKTPPSNTEPDAPFVASMKEAMLIRLASVLGSSGLGAMTGALRPALQRAMSKEGGILGQVMTADFVRALMVGYHMQIEVQSFGFVGGLIGAALPAIPVCGVLDYETKQSKRTDHEAS